MARKQSLVVSALALGTSLLAGCFHLGSGGSSDPYAFDGDETPVLTPSGSAQRVGSGVLDARRDGVFLRASGQSAAVLSVTSAGTRELFHVPAYAPWADSAHLVSRADDDVLVAVQDDLGPERIYHFDGTRTEELTDRLRASLILAHDPDNLIGLVQADIAEDGALAMLVQVGGQAYDAPFYQLCTLSPADDACVGVDALTGLPDPTPSDLVVEGGRTYLLADGALFVADATGPWSRALEGVSDVRVIDDGRVLALAPDAMHFFDAAGAQQTIAVDVGTSVFEGHSARGLWSAFGEVQPDGSCRGSLDFSGSCREAIVRSRLLVQHLALDGELRTLGHADFDGDLAVSRTLPLLEGRAQVDADGGTFTFDAPASMSTP